MKKRALRKERTLNLWQVVEGVLGHAVVPDLKVAVVAGGVAGGTDPGNLLALVDMIAHRYQQAAVMAVVGDIPVAMADLNQVAIAAHPPGVGDCTAIRRVNRSAIAVGNILSLIHI